MKVEMGAWAVLLEKRLRRVLFEVGLWRVVAEVRVRFAE